MTSIFEKVKKAASDTESPVIRLVRVVAAEAYHMFRNREELSFWTRVACWRRGFFAERAAFYDIERLGFGAFVSDYERRMRTGTVNAKFAAQLKGKGSMSKLLRDVGASVPKWFELGEGDEAAQLDEILKKESRVILKPRIGSGGSSIFDVEKVEAGFLINGRILPSLRSIPFDRGLEVFEFINQHDYSRRIFPKSTNCLRMLTIRDPDTGKPYLAGVSHRFGTLRSVPVDNFTKGGVAAGVNIDTGVIGPAIAKPTFGNVGWVDEHPDTGMPIKGVQVPGWPSVKKQLLDVADKVDGLNLGGWDVVITSDGSITVIEVNLNPDVDLMQIHHPLLVDSRTRTFYRQNGIIRRQLEFRKLSEDLRMPRD